MKVSLIVAVYKDVQALDLIVKALHHQTYKNFELVIAEDGQNPAMAEYIKKIQNLSFLHTTQEDKGIQKTRSMNNGIIASTGQYLIFIDGDCIPYSTFIEAHVALSEPKTVLSGRRVNLGPKYSELIRTNKLDSYFLEKNYVRKYLSVAKDAIEKHTEAGFYFNPKKWFYRNILKYRNSSTALLGCNYSCFKEDMLAINGYDESYGETAVGDDTDIDWRMRSYGCTIKTAKNAANLFHLYHSRGFREVIDHTAAFSEMYRKKEKGIFFCVQGISQHTGG